MVYRIDIDETFCTGVSENKYSEAKPLKERIQKINELYESGHIVTIETGRHWNNLELTLKQLREWGLKYHTLVMGKIPADVIIDDKAVNANDFFRGLK